MCTKVLVGDEMKNGLSYELEDYIYEMESRELIGVPSPGIDSNDPYAMLAQKEKDLILAAELGKALLEKNADLSRQNERLAEDFSQKLEVLEQDKYCLRRKLESLEDDYEARLSEIQTDAESFQKRLQQQEEIYKMLEREKSEIITELTEQNQRLTKQIQESMKQEEILNSQIQSLRTQCLVRRSNIDDHDSHVELIKKEVTILSERKLELEERIYDLMKDREKLTANLDASNDKIALLEKQGKEQESQLRSTEREADELRAVNMTLSDRLEVLSRHSSPSVGNTSLLNEMEMSDDKESMNMSQPISQRSFQDYSDEIEEDVEFEEIKSVPFNAEEEVLQLKCEILDVFNQIRTMIEMVRHERNGSLTSLETLSSDEVTTQQIKVGVLTQVLNELRLLLHDLLRREAHNGNSETLDLEVQLHKSKEHCDKLTRDLQQNQEELKRTQELVRDLQGKLTVTEVKLYTVEEERETLKKDLAGTHLAKDEIVKRAWEVRDQAVGRKNNCEIELARTRIDVVQINSQLMEAIQQKVELSQQLDQWQMDMQQLLETQMQKKLTNLEYREKQKKAAESATPTTNKRRSRLFNLLNR